MVYSQRLLVLFVLSAGLSVGLSACVLRTEAPPASQYSLSAMDLIPAEATVAGFVNAEEFSSTFDEFLEMDTFGEVRAEFDRARSELDKIGIDPFKDLDYAVAYASNTAAPVAVARGSFDLDRISELISRELPELRAHTLDGMTAWVLGSQDHERALGLSDDGTTAYIGQGLDVLLAAANSDGQSELSELAEPVASMDAWFVARDISTLIGTRMTRASISQVETLARAVQHISAGGSLNTDAITGTIVLHPEEGIEAADLAAIVRGGIAALRLQDMPDQARRQLEDLEVNDARGVVTIEGTLSRGTIESFRLK